MKLLKVFLSAVILLSGLVTLNACQTLNSPIEDYTWTLTSYSVSGELKTPLEGTKITVTFNSEDKTVSGSGGCNHYSGTYTIDGLNLTIDERMAVTEMWCGEDIGEQEHQYLALLAAADRFKLDQDNLIIYCGQQTLNFERKE